MKKRKLILGLLMMAFVVASSLTLFSCYPYSSTNPSEFDLVATLHKTDLSSYKNYRTFVMRDSIAYVTDGSGSANLPRTYDNTIRTKVLANLQSYGYTRLTNILDTASADLIVSLAVTNSTTYYIDSYYPGDYWGWGYGGGYYYPWTTAYAVSSGSVITSIVDKKNYQSGTNKPTVVWMGILNGATNDNTANTNQRISDGIDKCFSQSPYLKVN
jgi:hypothetical protein